MSETLVHKKHCHEHNHTSEHINSSNESKTLLVIIVTLITMFIEIFFGFITNSMALLSDGFHMSTHVLALTLSFVAYMFIRKISNYENCEIVSEKISAFAGYTSSLFLSLTGGWIIYEAFERLYNPLKISFNDAIIVAVIGLIVNLVCIFIMEYGEKLNEKDYNFKSAYFHILADAMTSIFAIFALCMGKYFGMNYMDAIMGVVGGILILKWSIRLIFDTSKILLDTDKLCKK